MNRIRGVLMLLAAGVAFYQGWKLHTLHVAQWSLSAFGLGIIALGLAIWHLTRKPDRPRA